MKKFYIIIVLISLTSVSGFCEDFWEQVGNVGGTAFSFSVDSIGNIYAGTYNSIYKSTDDGITWNKKVTGGGYSNYIWFSLNKAGHIFCGTHSNNLMTSTDNGENWKSLTTVGHPDVRPMIFLSDGDALAVPYSAGLHRSKDNCQTWTHEFIDSLNVHFIYSFAVANNGYIFAGTDHYLYKSTDNGKSWIQMNFDSLCPHVRALMFAKNGDLYAGSESYFCGMFKSTDNGNTWEKAFDGLDLGVYDFVFNIIENPNGNLIISTNSDGVYISKDKGRTAYKENSGISGSFWWQTFISPGGHLYVGTQKGIYRSKGVVTDVSEQENEKLPIPNLVSENQEFELFYSGDFRIVIYDLTGRILLQQQGSNSLKLNLSDFHSGLFLYKLYSNNKLFTGKFFKI